MLPNSDEKAKQSFLKKRSFSLLNKRHSRSQSSSSSAPNHEPLQTIPSSFNLENNKRGWLESMPVQVTPSRSLDTRSTYATKSTATRHHASKSKDIDLLGVVSDEDIFKLTELTSRLPEVNPNKHHHRRRSEYNNENITRKRVQSEQQQSDDDPVIPEKITSQQTKTPGISSSTPPSITAAASLEVESSERKRRTWLYKMKPNKAPRKDNQSNSSSMSVSASIAKEFYDNNPVPINNFGRVNNTINHVKSSSTNRQSNGEPSSSSNHDGNRRHSFDSIQSFGQESMSKENEDQELLNLIENKEFIAYHDQALDQWDQDWTGTMDHSHEERHNFHLVVSAENDDENMEQEDKDVLLELKKNSSSAVNNIDVLSNHSGLQEKVETFMFDNDSIPSEVQKLIDVYEGKGKAEIKEVIVKYKHLNKDDEDMKDEDEDDDDEEEEMVDYSDLITNNYTSQTQKIRREIAVVTTSRSDNIEFTKLIPVSMEGSANDGPLMDLHVSLFGENNIDSNTSNHEEFQDTILSIEQNLERFQSFKKNADSFLVDHLETMKSLNLYCNTDLPRNLSFPDLKSASKVQFTEESEVISESSSSISRRPMYESRKEKYKRNARSMYASSNEYPFDCRQKEIMSLVSSLKHELDKFKDSLDKTETFVSTVQVDMDDTRNRMKTYIKDIPKSHYSALKKLEVDIEFILSNRAKNPWLDTGYAVLSYILTLFALVVWIVIYILKLGKKVILFPKKLWVAYSDYLVERNKLVKNASMNSVAGAPNTDTPFGRSNRVARQDIT